MRHAHLLRSSALLATTAMLATGCGLMADPAVGTSDEVLDALLALRDGAEVRVTADLDLDQDEVRDVLADDPEARELVGEAVDGRPEDVDALVADLERAQAELADHAVLLATGADGSARMAAEYQSSVWADLRVGTDLDTSDDPADGFRFDLQLQVDWATAAQVFDQPDLLGDLDEAAAQVAPFLGEMPQLAPVQELVLAFLGGELVGVGGEFTPDLLDGLGLSGDELAGTAAPSSMLGPDGLDLEPRELAETAFTFDGYRREGEATLVDVTVEVRAIAELVLDGLAQAPDATGMSFDDVEELRADLDELPDQLVDVATLRFDTAGALQQLRVDVLDAGLQLAQAAEPEDDDLATAQRVVSRLDTTGLFIVFEVEQVGQTATVLGDPSTAVTPEELAAAFGALVFGGLGGGFDPGALDLGPSAGGSDTDPTGEDAFAQGLRPSDLAVGDCFDDDALFGFQDTGASPTVPCDQPHDNEAFAVVPAEADSHEELVGDEPDADACIEAFADHVGVPYRESELIVDVVRPSATAFAEGARESVCYLYGVEPLTGSMAGSGR